MTWLRDGTSSLSCSGQHDVNCEHSFTPTFNSDGDYKCTGYNTVRNVEKENPATTSIVVVKDVSVTMSSAGVTNGEVEFGTSFTITCVADGGRIPHYLQLSLTDSDGTIIKELVVYDIDNNKTPNKVTVDETAQTLTLVYTASSSYNDTGNYKCLGKNRAEDNAVKEFERSQNVVIGMYGN